MSNPNTPTNNGSEKLNPMNGVLQLVSVVRKAIKPNNQQLQQKYDDFMNLANQSSNKKRAIKYYKKALKIANKLNIGNPKELQRKIEFMQDQEILDSINTDAISLNEADEILRTQSNVVNSEPSHQTTNNKTEQNGPKGLDAYKQMFKESKETEGLLYENHSIFSLILKLLQDYNHNKKKNEVNTLIEKINLDHNNLFEIFKIILSLLRSIRIESRELKKILDQKGLSGFDVIYKHGFLLPENADLDSVKSALNCFNMIMNAPAFKGLKLFGNVYPQNPGEKNIAEIILLACNKRSKNKTLEEIIADPDCDGIPIFEEKKFFIQPPKDTQDCNSDSDDDEDTENEYHPQYSNIIDAEFIEVNASERNEDVIQEEAEEKVEEETKEEAKEEAEEEPATQIDTQEVINSHVLDEELKFFEMLMPILNNESHYDVHFKNQYFEGQEYEGLVNKMPEYIPAILSALNKNNFAQDNFANRFMEEIIKISQPKNADELTGYIKDIYREAGNSCEHFVKTNPLWEERMCREICSAIESEDTEQENLNV